MPESTMSGIDLDMDINPVEQPFFRIGKHIMYLGDLAMAT
jgi:hypothetical protein